MCSFNAVFRVLCLGGGCFGRDRVSAFCGFICGSLSVFSGISPYCVFFEYIKEAIIYYYYNTKPIIIS